MSQDMEPVNIHNQNSSGEEEELHKVCILCKDVPDNIICLGCNHDICLMCAAKVILTSHQDTQDIDLSRLECPSCGQVTVLSEEVQLIILEFLKSEEFELEGQPEEEIEAEEEEEYEEDSPQEMEEEGSQQQSEAEEQYEDGLQQDEEGIPSNSQMGDPSQVDEEDDHLQIEGMDEQEDQENTHSNLYHYQQRPNTTTDVSSRDQGGREISRSIKSETRGAQESSHLGGDVSFHFACLVHPQEEYAYYSPSARSLYCAQCILNDPQLKNRRDIRSLRRSLPLIMQHFQDLLNQVEVSRSLLENRKKDQEIKFEDIKAKMGSVKYMVEMRFEELIDYINDIKSQILSGMDTNMEKMLSELKTAGDKFGEKIEYFDAVLAQVNDLQSQEESSDEDLLGFFFANQARIQNIVNEEASQNQLNTLMRQFREVEDEVELQMRGEMQKCVSKISSGINDSFKEFMEGKQLLLLDEGMVPAADSKSRPLSSYQVGGSVVHDSNGFQKSQGTSSYRRRGQQLKQQQEDFENRIQEKDSTTATSGGNFGSSMAEQNFQSRNRQISEILSKSKAPYLAEERPRINRRRGSKYQNSDLSASFRQRNNSLSQSAQKERRVNNQRKDPITEIKKKLKKFELKSIRRPLNNEISNSWIDTGPAYSKQFGTSSQSPFLNLKNSRSKNIDSLRMFRQKIRNKLSTECMNKRNRSFFLSQVGTTLK